VVKFRPHLVCQIGADQKRRDTALTLLQGNAGILASKYAAMFPLNEVQGGAMVLNLENGTSVLWLN